MDLIQAIILGLVQGLTEFLPISSSGHVLLVPAFFGWEDPGAGFTAVIQIGTVIAVLGYFWKDLLKILSQWVKGLGSKDAREEQGYRLGWAIVIGTIPAVVLGLLFESQIDNQFRSPILVAGMLIAVGLVMWGAERFGSRSKNLDHINNKSGFVIGLWQALALIPGSSRSGSTIAGGLFLGLDRVAAARFSFLLSVPSVLGSGLYKLYRERSDLLGDGLVPTVVATVVALASGWWAIAFLMKYLQTHSTGLFIGYRLVLGALILVLFSSGILG